jgi:transposase
MAKNVSLHRGCLKGWLCPIRRCDKESSTAVQVSDRFHLIKNLTDYAKSSVSQKIVGVNFRIAAGESNINIGGGYWEKPELHGACLPERLHNASTEKKKKLVEKVRKLAATGFSSKEIAIETGLSPNTVNKYIDEKFDPENKDYGTKKPSKLKPYTDKIDSMINERRKFKDIEDVIRRLGYDGSASTIRMYATRQRGLLKAARTESNKNTELIERKIVTKLLYKPIEKVRGITVDQVERVFKEYPVIGRLYDLVRSFKSIMAAKHVDEIDVWMETATKLNIDEINSFINGITSDLDAVKNAARYEYNNGLAEGSVNKIKLIKRIMYGRCSFNLLRNKALHLEANKRFN